MPGTTMEFEHRGPRGWEPYTPAQNEQITEALSGKTPWQANCARKLPGTPFELRFGGAAVSDKVLQPPASGILQVNLETHNSRVVRACGHTSASRTKGRASTSSSMASAVVVSAFEHKGPQGWEMYSREQNHTIAAAVGDRSPWQFNGTVPLPGTPFEVRFGSAAVSRKMQRPPATGILQVNTKTENSRVVRDAECPYGDHAGETSFEEHIPRDTHGNVEGEAYDLSPDNCNTFRGQTIAVLQLYSTQLGEDFTFAAPKAAMERKGFTVHVWTELPKLPDFKSTLDRVCQLWVISGQSKSVLGPKYLEVIRELVDSRKGLFIWGDNDPFTDDANKILASLPETKGLSMSGSFQADKVLQEAKKPKQQGYTNHLVTTGLEALYEGITIAAISGPLSQQQVLVRSSDKKVVTACFDEGGKRIMIDGGFTRMYENFWDRTAGTARFVTNAACWLYNYENRA